MCRRAKKGDWFRGDEKSNESVIFVPATPGSVLKRRYQEVLEKAKVRMAVADVPGPSVKRGLQKYDLFKKKMCRDAEKCMACYDGDGGDAGMRGNLRKR